jgi:hypothetical protein
VMPTPRATPPMPPRPVRITASDRNWRRISRRVAPMALADADLAGPLGDRDQHDVGDPDAAHE